MSVRARDLEIVSNLITAVPPFPMYPAPQDYENGAIHALMICWEAKERALHEIAEAKKRLIELLDDSGIDARRLKETIGAHLADLGADINGHLLDVGNEISGALHEAAERVAEEQR